MSNVTVSLQVNGMPVSRTVDSRTLLVELIREHLKLTGTHVGCDTAQCGCCTVQLDGHAVKSCSMLAIQANGGQVTTIEGLATGDALHPVQQAFRDCHGLQCGYCTPGMVMATIELLKRTPKPSELQIRAGLEGNICRCTGYENIVRSVQAAAGV
ncbi:MAG: (2Fe-2S)-binding protein [Burkholderiaceae bacterium]|nr:(2Fe-2S)-binding protein [Burkholderiaceae bacterium]